MLPSTSRVKEMRLNTENRISGAFEIKKRVYKYENEVLTQKQRRFAPSEYGDRFIPRRYALPSRLSNGESFNLSQSGALQDILNLDKRDGYWRLHSLKTNIQIAMEIGAENETVLSFHDAITRVACRRALNTYPLVSLAVRRFKNNQDLDWPCKPRPMPLAYNDSTHDLPGFDTILYTSSIIDWSKSGRIAASFECDLVLWVPPTMSKVTAKSTVIYRLGRITALSFDPFGDKLAAGIDDVNRNLLQVWQIHGDKGIQFKGKISVNKRLPFDQITAVAWDPNGKNIVCGFRFGEVVHYAFPAADTLHRIEYHRRRITCIKYSIHRNYIAVTDFAGHLVILHSDTFNVFATFDNANYYAWHPWNESDFFIGRTMPAKIVLIDLTTQQVNAYYARMDKKYQLNAISLNPLSAELVASFSNKEKKNEIVVMASMNRITDNLSVHNDSVYCILWSPQGFNVATAGYDETLNIWNFFGMSQRKANELAGASQKKTKTRKYSQLDLSKAFMQLR